MAKKDLLVVLVKKASVEPIPVARPAPRVTRNARINPLSIVTSLLGQKNRPITNRPVPLLMLYLVLAAAATSVFTAIAVHEYLLEVPVVIGGGFVLTNYVRRAGAREEVVILIAGWA